MKEEVCSCVLQAFSFKYFLLLGGIIMFKVVIESLFNDRYGRSKRKEFVVLSKAIAIQKATAFSKHSCVEVIDDHHKQCIAYGDPVIGFKEIENYEHNL